MKLPIEPFELSEKQIERAEEFLTAGFPLEPWRAGEVAAALLAGYKFQAAKLKAAEDALAEAKSDYDDERKFIETLEEESGCSTEGSTGSDLIAWILRAKQRLAQTREVAAELLASLKEETYHEGLDVDCFHCRLIKRTTALLGPEKPPADTHVGMTTEELAALLPKIAKPCEEEKTGWRLIETAPRDGTEITGGWEGRKPFTSSGTPIVWQNTSRRSGWFMLSPTYENDNGEFFPGKWINERDYPTHWMPLIDPPTTPADAEGGRER